MIKPVSDLHTHTTFSSLNHGKGTVEQNVQAAIDRGLEAVAISDHGFSHIFFGIRDIDAYLKEIKRVRDLYADKIEVLTNVELNIISLDGELDLPAGYEDAFDKLMFGYHKMAGYKGLRNKLDFMLPRRDNQKTRDKYTDAYIAAMERYNIDVITHPGLGIPIDKVRLASEAARLGTAMEINAKHPNYTVDELRQCADTGVMFCIGSDAHTPNRVGSFGPALQLAESAGIEPKQVINAKQV